MRDGIVLDLARQLRIDIALETGQATEALDVTAQARLVETENGSLGAVVQNQMLTGLPNLSRNPQSYELLTPGAVNTSNGPVTNGGLARIDPYYIQAR